MRPRVRALLLALVAATSVGAQSPCEVRIAALGQACLLYAEQHGGALPAALSALYYEAYVSDLDAFACPAHPVAIDERERIDLLAGYVLCPEVQGPGLRRIVKDLSAANHEGRGVHVFMSDGSVRFEVEGGSEPRAVSDVAVFAPLGGAVYLGLRTAALAAGDPRLGGLPIATGLLVNAVQPGGVGASWGLRAGDVLASLGGRALAGERALSEVIAECEPEDRLPLLSFREGRAMLRIVVSADLPALIRGESPRPAAALPAIRELSVAPTWVSSTPWIQGHLTWAEAVPGTQLLVAWFHEDASMARGVAVLGGEGKATLSVLDIIGAGFRPGAWRVTASVGGKPLAVASFRVE